MQTIDLDNIHAIELLDHVADTSELFFAVTHKILHDKILLQGRFDKDGVFIPANQQSAIGPLSDDECRQLVDWALGNLNPCECFWYEPEPEFDYERDIVGVVV